MIKPFPFQEQVIERVRQGYNVLNADKCGLGKTLTALIPGSEVVARGGCVLVVCPKRLKSQWVQAIQGMGQEVRVEGDWPLAGWIVIHYEQALRLPKSVEKRVFDMVVCDEAHYIKNRQAQRTKAVKSIKTRRKLALTATPFNKDPADMWSILHWLYPDRFRSYWDFQQRHTKMEVNGWTGYTKILGVVDAQKLANEISFCTFQRNKRDVAPELPPRIEEDIILEMEPKQKALFDRIRKAKDIVADFEGYELTGEEVKDLIQTPLVKLVRMLQIASDPRLVGVDAPSVKLEWLREWLENNPEEVTVIFTRFRRTAELLAQELEACICVGGADPKLWQPFLEGKNRLLVGTIAGMSEGLNLQMASTAIFIDMEWSAIKMEQALDRIHRINITEPKYIINLIVKGSPDVLVAKALRHQWSEAELIKNFLQENS